MARIYTSSNSLCKFPSANTQDTLKTAIEIKAIKFQGFQRLGSRPLVGFMSCYQENWYKLDGRKQLRMYNKC